MERVFFEASEGAFSHDYVSFPLVGGAPALGTMHLATSGGGAGRETLRLAGAVAEFVALVLGAFVPRDSGNPGRELLEVTVGALDCGVIVYDHAGDLALANAAALRLFDGKVPARWDHLEQVASSAEIGAATARERRFVCRGSGGRALHVATTRSASDAPGVAVVRDLSEATTACRDLLRSEVYGCLVRRERCAIGVLRARATGAVLDEYERWVTGTARPARAGLWDAETFVLVSPGGGRGEVERVLLEAARSLREGSVILGTASLELDGDTPEAMIERALAEASPASASDRPSLLVFDTSQAVVDAVSVVFRRSCVVRGFTDPRRAFETLENRCVDAVVWEFAEIRSDRIRTGLGRVTSEQACPEFVFLAQTAGPWEPERLGLPRGKVFRKPFAVEEFERCVRAAWSARRAMSR
jgi:hypothetical protein